MTVRLPLARPQAETTTDARGRSAAPQRSSKVIVVDDNVDTARGMARLLGLLGHDVRVAHDGPSALEAARAERPDVVLLDIGLPGMDGHQVALTLRGEGFVETVLIAVSGYGEQAARARSREAGFDHYLVKPVDFDALITLFHRPH
jgi:CheY-like chemotaxis protein